MPSSISYASLSPGTHSVMRSRRRYGLLSTTRTTPGLCSPPPSTSTFDQDPQRVHADAWAKSAQTAAGEPDVLLTASIVVTARLCRCVRHGSTEPTHDGCRTEDRFGVDIAHRLGIYIAGTATPVSSR